MARPSHYSPAIDRFLVAALYHEARLRRVPMTRLVDGLLRRALEGSRGWDAAIADGRSPSGAIFDPGSGSLSAGLPGSSG